MTQKDLVRRVRELGEYSKKFRVFYRNSVSGNVWHEDARLFITSVNGEDTVCEYKKSSRRWGTPVRASYVYKIELPPTKSDLEIVRKKGQKVVEMLSKSGLWELDLEEYKKLLSLPDDKLQKVIYNIDSAKEFGIDIQHLLGANYVGSIVEPLRRGFKTIKYENDKILEYVGKFFSKEVDDVRIGTWRDTDKYGCPRGYDKSAHFTRDKDGICRGWYSEEFVNCGNGHYYFALDATHAIWGGDD